MMIDDATKSAARKQRQLSQKENIRRALIRWKLGKGGARTQARLQQAGYNFANQNPGHPPAGHPQRTEPYQDPKVVAVLMQPVVGPKARLATATTDGRRPGGPDARNYVPSRRRKRRHMQSPFEDHVYGKRRDT